MVSLLSRGSERNDGSVELHPSFEDFSDPVFPGDRRFARLTAHAFASLRPKKWRCRVSHFCARMIDDDVGVSVVAVMRYIVFFFWGNVMSQRITFRSTSGASELVLELWGVQSESVAYTLHGNFEAQPTDGDFKKYESQVRNHVQLLFT